jgi:hypothetical protein
MTPDAFVAALAASVRRSAEREADYLAGPPSDRPPAHLAQFSTWFQRLPLADQAVARDVIRYAAEGSLFVLLTYLDNIASLTDRGGAFELWYTARDGARVRLNSPDGDLLTDLFNNAQPRATADPAGGER